MVVHATEAELLAYPVTVPDGVNIPLLLLHASRDVDRALFTAFYATDDNGVATDADVLEALKNATIEQAAGKIDAGEAGTTVTPTVTNFTIGKLAVQQSAGSTTPDPATKVRGLWPQAWLVLQQAGLTNGEVVTR